MEARTLAAALLKCGYLDIDYLVDLIDACELDLDEILDEFDWLNPSVPPTANDLILLVFNNVAQTFLEKTVK